MREPPHICCRWCRYPLQGLTSSICPECGREFDLNDRRTYTTSKREPLRPEALISIACPIAFMLFTPLFSFSGPPWRRPPILDEVIMHLLLIIPVAVGLGCGISAMRGGTDFSRTVGAIGLAVCGYLTWMLLIWFQHM